MPELLLFLPCEKAIISTEDNGLSIISVLQDVTVAKPPTDKTVAATAWTVVAYWKQIEGDAKKKYEQQVRLVLPDGTTGIESVQPFEFDKGNQRNILKVGGFPVGRAGIYHLKLSYREVGKLDWQEKADYEIRVIHSNDKQ